MTSPCLEQGATRGKRRRVRRLLSAGAALLLAPGLCTPRVSGAALATAPAWSDSVAAAVARRLRGARQPGVDDRAWRRVGRLYSARSFAPVWFAPDGRLDHRAAVVTDALARADADGLRPSDYPLQALAGELEHLPESRSLERIAHAEVLLTSALAMYAEDLLTGRLNPRAIESAWRIDPKVVDVDSALAATLGAGEGGAAEGAARDFGSALQRLRPQAEGYAELVNALAHYRELARRGGWPTVGGGPAIRPGDTSARAPALRRRLTTEGYLPSDAPLDTALRYDGPLPVAVARLQARHGLEVDSVVGPRTLAVMNVPVERRVRQIEASLERLRWLPPHLGDRYVFVNIPAFRLDAFDEGRRVLSMRVIVGADYGRRATPIFSDSMRYVVFNPYWNVPGGIAARELWPAQRQDPSYFGRNGYEVVRASWGTYVRQRPGPGNALGRVKFIFPNDYNVYLHDTPARELFAEGVRAFSHGCIRVERPLDLARFALGPQGWDSAAVAEAVAAGDRRRVDLREKLPVYIVYLTAFVRDGAVAFRNDLYDYDARILRALR